MLQRLMLFIMGIMITAAGVSVVSLDLPNAVLAQDPSLHAQLRLLTPHQIGWVFVGIGLFSMLAALNKRFVLMGYGAAMFLLTSWAMLSGLSWLETGYWRCIFSLVNYGMFAALLYVASRAVVVPKPLADKLVTQITVPPISAPAASASPSPPQTPDGE